MEEDAQPLEKPIVAPVDDKKFELVEREVPETTYSLEFLSGLLSNPELVRNVAVCGHLHHGKTGVMDMLVHQTHDTRFSLRDDGKLQRYTDMRLDERDRGISVKTAPMSLVLPNSEGKSYLCTLLDTPGHCNFNDEVTAAMRLADGVLLVVDAAEGVMLRTQRAIQQACQEDLPIVLFVSKIDRLITELKLPPNDAFFKLRHVIHEVNKQIGVFAQAEGSRVRPVDPLDGSVCFGSGLYGLSFTLFSFAKVYATAQGGGFDYTVLARKLWGDRYFDPETRRFSAKPVGGRDRTFVEFILDPIYKIVSSCVGEDGKHLQTVLGEFGASLRPSQLHQSSKPLIADAFRAVFGEATGLVDMLVEHVPSAREGAASKVRMDYTGDATSAFAEAASAGRSTGPLLVQVAKMVPRPDASGFDALCRVLSGSVKPGDTVRVLGEAYSPDDEEDSAVAEVAGVQVWQSRYRVALSKAPAGSVVLLGGIGGTVTKTATVVAPEGPADEGEVGILRPLRFLAKSVVKVAIEPLNPSELPKVVEGLRSVSKSYPLAATRVEESGEHTVLGTGELFLDSLMKDLREVYAEVEVKVADPVVSFCETVVETSSLKCFAETPNRKNKVTMIAEPLEKGLAEDIEAGDVSAAWPRKRVAAFFTGKHGWDALAARSLWAFGPDAQGPNLLLDDTLPGECDKKMLAAVRNSVTQGFQWACREGPLCDEPLRGVKFKLMHAEVSADPIARSAGQVIPTSRRVCYSAFLMATPRLLEPVMRVEITAPADCISAIYTILTQRRGHVVEERPRPGTPIFVVKAFLPTIEHFGFETDLRYHTQGMAFCQTVFDHWQVVPGDPLDRSVVLRPLEPSPVNALAREFMVKTRRRKGMAEDVSVSKFFDSELLLDLARQDAELSAMM